MLVVVIHKRVREQASLPTLPTGLPAQPAWLLCLPGCHLRPCLPACLLACTANRTSSCVAAARGRCVPRTHPRRHCVCCVPCAPRTGGRPRAFATQSSARGRTPSQGSRPPLPHPPQQRQLRLGSHPLRSCPRCLRSHRSCHQSRCLCRWRTRCLRQQCRCQRRRRPSSLHQQRQWCQLRLHLPPRRQQQHQHHSTCLCRLTGLRWPQSCKRWDRHPQQRPLRPLRQPPLRHPPALCRPQRGRRLPGPAAWHPPRRCTLGASRSQQLPQGRGQQQGQWQWTGVRQHQQAQGLLLPPWYSQTSQASWPCCRRRHSLWLLRQGPPSSCHWSSSRGQRRQQGSSSSRGRARSSCQTCRA